MLLCEQSVASLTGLFCSTCHEFSYRFSNRAGGDKVKLLPSSLLISFFVGVLSFGSFVRGDECSRFFVASLSFLRSSLNSSAIKSLVVGELAFESTVDAAAVVGRGSRNKTIEFLLL